MSAATWSAEDCFKCSIPGFKFRKFVCLHLPVSEPVAHCRLSPVSGFSVAAYVLETGLGYAGNRCRRIPSSADGPGSRDSIRRIGVGLTAFTAIRKNGSDYV